MLERPVKPAGEARRRVALVVWGAQVMALVMFFALTRVVGGGSGAAGEGRALLLALAAAGLTTFALSFVLKAKLLAQAAERRRPELATSAYVVAFALCEAAALFGLVAHFATGAPEALYFFVPAAVGLALHFPRRRDFEGPAGGAA
jgi:hypothetical protein